MGEVWLAQHTLLGRQAAIKIMSAEMARDDREVTRFLQEAQIAAQLRHTNIVRVEDVGCTDDGRPYLVMEFLKGESLSDRLDQVGVFTPRMAKAVIEPACAALEFAHAAGVIHRDIKPANLFLAREHRDEVLKVLDFGLARLLHSERGPGRRLTAPRQVVGTPKYMSPEQVQGVRDIDGRCDLWSLGVVAFRMLTGKHPFPTERSGYDILVQILTYELKRPSSYNPDLPLAIDAWMSRALERDRSRRFQTPREFAQAFAQAVDVAESEEERTSVAPAVQHFEGAPFGALEMPAVRPVVALNTRPHGWDTGVSFEPPSDPSLPNNLELEPSGAKTNSSVVLPAVNDPSLPSNVGMDSESSVSIVVPQPIAPLEPATAPSPPGGDKKR